MQVLQLGPYPPPYGGVQTNLVAIRDYLVRHGVPCRVLNLTRHRQPDAEGVFFPSSPFDVIRLLLRLPRDIIHVHIGGDISNRLLGLALFCSFLPGSRVVLTLHSGGYPGSKAGLSSHPRTFRAFVFRRLDRLIAVNQQLVDLFTQRFAVDPSRVRLILPYALPTADPSAVLPAPIHQFLSTHSPVFLSMGWLEPEYDYPLQIRALQNLRNRFPHAGLMIFGTGRLEQDLLDQARQSGCRQSILFAGDVPHAAALAAMKRCSVFLRTTLYDGDSISVREALHLGVPVVATDNGMRPPGVHLMTIGDLDGLLQAITRALDNPPTAVPPITYPEANIHAVVETYRELTRELTRP